MQTQEDKIRRIAEQEALRIVGIYGKGGGSGAGSLAMYQLTDVNSDGYKVAGAAEGKVLRYGSDGKWYADEITISKITGLQTALDSKLDISFFGRLFQAYNGTTAVNPNDTTTTIDNIKAMFGFWTEQYLSARGRGAGGGGGGGTGNVTWDELAGTAVSPHKVDISYLTGAISTLTGGTSDLDNKRYAVQLNGNNQLFVDVPWTDTIYTLPAEVSYRRYNFNPSTAEGGKWHRLGNYKTMGDATNFVVEVYDGSGYNGQARQNSVTKITIKDGWQATRAAANSVGAIIERSGYPFETEISIVATSDTEGALWIYLPSQYVSGSYSIYGSYASWTHNSGNSDDTTTRPTTNQTQTGDGASYRYYDLTYNSSVSKSGQTLTVKINGTEQSLTNTDHYDWSDITNKPATATRWPAFSEVTGQATAGQVPNIENLTNFSSRVYDATLARTANTVLAGPTSGNAAAATFRALVAADIPSLAISKITGLQTALDSKLDIAFFSSMFKAYAGTTEVAPNGGDTSTIDNIKAMFGFWTEQYLSARGRGAGGGGGGGTGNVTWDELAGTAATGRKVDISYLADAISTLTGYTTSGRNYAVEVNASNQLYVNVPWENTTYSFSNADATLAWSTRTKIATVGGTDIYVTMPANPDTWRPVVDNLTSTSATDCLSANQGKTLKGYIDTLNDYFTNGVANSAAKLTTVSKTAWGQTFWTAYGVPDSISGDMTSVGNITMNNNKSIYMKDSGGDAQDVLTLNSSNQLILGGDTANEGYNTYLRGYAVYLQYSGSNTGLMLNSSGNVGIGTTSPSYKLSVSGDIVATGCLTGRVTSASDIHAKNISSTVLPLSLVEIANAPTIRFKWKQGDDQADHVGSIAQYWQSVMPEVIWKNKEGMLTLEYGTAALISSITIAREVAALKQRIKELKRILKN